MITKREDKILRKYSKSIGIDYKFNKKLYLRGSPKQRAIDLVSQEFTIWIREKQKQGLIKATKKGKVSKKATDKFVQMFIAEKGGIKKLPKFFSTEIYQPETPPEPSKNTIVIEKEAKPYLNRAKKSTKSILKPVKSKKH
jgi:hypothetical protein